MFQKDLLFDKRDNVIGCNRVMATDFEQDLDLADIDEDGNEIKSGSIDSSSIVKIPPHTLNYIGRVLVKRLNVQTNCRTRI